MPWGIDYLRRHRRPEEALPDQVRSKVDQAAQRVLKKAELVEGRYERSRGGWKKEMGSAWQTDRLILRGEQTIPVRYESSVTEDQRKGRKRSWFVIVVNGPHEESFNLSGTVTNGSVDEIELGWRRQDPEDLFELSSELPSIQSFLGEFPEPDEQRYGYRTATFNLRGATPTFSIEEKYGGSLRRQYSLFTRVPKLPGGVFARDMSNDYDPDEQYARQTFTPTEFHGLLTGIAALIPVF